jgi:hypothetical protein
MLDVIIMYMLNQQYMQNLVGTGSSLQVVEELIISNSLICFYL